MWLKDSQLTLQNAGGKATALAEMKKIGINVPDFIVLSVAGGETISERLEPVLTKEEINQLSRLLDDCCPAYDLFSVRSSAVKEDSHDLSFAGLFDTYLNVSRDQLAENIAKCLASARSKHVEDYADHNQLDQSDLKMAVIIQGMVASEKAGVLFTANPNGLLNEQVLVVGNGLGDGIVDGIVPVTTYYIKADEGLSYYEQDEDSPLLEAAELASLLQQAKQLQTTSKIYLDCEFAISGGQVYYLQSRPITTLKPKDQAGTPLILNNSNLVESYPGISSPLTESFIQYAYQQVFRGVAWRFSKSDSLLEDYDDAFSTLVVSANGRMYYNMNHLYSLLQFLPFPQQVLPIWQEMMGFSQKEVILAPNLKKKTSLFDSLRISARILKEFFTTPSQMAALNQSFDQVEDYFNAHYSNQMGVDEVKSLYNGLAERILMKWDITLVNDLYAFVYTGLLKKSLSKWGGAESEEQWNQWFSGIPAISSIEPVRAMEDLANYVLRHQLLDDLLALTSVDELEAYLEKDQTGFAQHFTYYINRYGDRSLEELKLETETFRANPMKAIQQLISFCQHPTNHGQTKQADQSLTFSASFWKKGLVRYLSKHARLGIENRELSRLNRSRIYGMVRSMMLRMGKLAEEVDLLDHSRDIFWLTMDEVMTLSEETSAKIIVEERRSRYKGYDQLPPYGYLMFQDKVVNKAVQRVQSLIDDEQTNYFQGIATSSGKVSGDVLVIANPNEVTESVIGKILVTTMTDPGWVFLLTQAKGIIAEKGSLLSHTAIISRELNIPAVVGIKQITQRLKTGDQVELDANSGRVTILKRKGEQNES